MRIFTYTVAIAAVAVSMSLFYQILFQQPIVVKLRSVAVGGKSPAAGPACNRKRQPNQSPAIM
jgi:hypothetical protein